MNDVLSRLRTSLQGRYTVDREIGRGGMSLVYLARDLKHVRNVAIKVLRPELTASIGALRFLSEIRIAANLEHPNILPLFDSGEADGLLFYTMPLVEGESLRERIDREGALPVDDALRITREVGEALAYAHEQGVVHRDIKPENILLASGTARVADFGIARARSEAGEYESITDANLAVGTPEYMSPEQASGSESLDQRTDIYSLGCVLYAMLAGEPPFSARTPQAIIAKHLGEKVPTLEVVRPGVSLQVTRIVEKALSKVPADRYATAGEFVAAIEQSVELPPIRPPIITLETAVRLTKRHPVMTVLLILAVLVSTSPFVRSLVRVGTPPGFDGRPESVVVVPYHSSASSEREKDAVVDLASLISRELNSWESIRAVPRVSLAGPMFDLGLNGPTLEFIDDGVELAMDLGVQALITVTLGLEGNSALLDVGVFDASTGRVVGQPFHSQGDLGDPHTLVAPIVNGILGLSNVPLQMADLRRGTDNPDALMQDIEGLAFMARWRLSEAEQSFRRAIDLDSSFALAFHHLAETLYWQTAQSARRRGDLGPEIQQLTAAAVRNINGLTSRDSMHIRAFHSFQAGEYPEARALYNTLLSVDSTDVYAWLLLGSVEYRDPWLVQNPVDSSFLPRGNFNVAMHAFSAALRLQPAFDLGYGHLFDINRRVRWAVDMGGCPGFELPRDVLIVHWEQLTPQQEIAFCPVALDSISWVRKEVFDTLDRSGAVDGANGLIQRSLALLRRWAAYAPNEPKPREELARAVVGQRSRIGVGSPGIIDSIAEVAAEYASAALALRGDTVPFELLKLGGLFLGAGRRDSAVALTDAALAGHDTSAPHHVAANVLLASGQIFRALEIVSTPSSNWFLPDPVADSLISFGGVEPIFDRLRILGTVGVSGPVLETELDKIGRLWSEPQYSARQVDLLRRYAALRVSIGLAFDQAALSSWLGDSDLASAMWNALLNSESDLTAARAHLEASLDTKILGFSESSKSFLHGLVAQRTGDFRLAVSQFSRIDSLPLSLEVFDTGWGLRVHSYLLRAEAYEELGDTGLAVEFYERLSEAWVNGDSLVQPLVRRAESGIGRLTREP